MAQTPIRITVAVVAVVAAALLVAAMPRGIAPAIVALAGGAIAIVALATRPAPARPDGASDRTTPPPEPPIAPLGEAIADPLVMTRDGRVIVANQAARTLLGEHILGEDVRLVIRHPAAAERLADRSGDGAPIDLVGLGKSEQRWAMRVSPLIDGHRAIHLVDQTARYAAERMRVDFVANASHELKTPLASLLGYSEALREGGAGDDPALRARFLGIMTTEAQRMQRLIEDLISLSRIEAEKYRLPTASVDLGDLADRVVGQIEASGDTRAADLALSVAPGLPPINGDAAQLSQLLHNLIGNAMKYGSAGTPVTVDVAAAEGALARLTVTDRGEGIAREHIPRLTERFYRADPSRSRTLGGTGLGLAIVKHIVERHRGRLDIASTVGEGTTVTVLLPLFSG